MQKNHVETEQFPAGMSEPRNVSLMEAAGKAASGCVLFPNSVNCKQSEVQEHSPSPWQRQGRDDIRHHVTGPRKRFSRKQRTLSLTTHLAQEERLTPALGATFPIGFGKGENEGKMAIPLSTILGMGNFNDAKQQGQTMCPGSLKEAAWS